MGFDPIIKYEVPGMIQGKQEERSEFTFAEAIASLMKQEPDVAYIGEISGETEARATIQGAFAKRTVFGRMTANDSLNAIQNLVDMGIQPFLIAASLTAVMFPKIVHSTARAEKLSSVSDSRSDSEQTAGWITSPPAFRPCTFAKAVSRSLSLVACTM